MQGHARLFLAVRYLRDPRLLLPVGMSVGEGYAPDALLGAQALRAANPGGVLLADTGFAAAQVFAEARGKFLPMIRLKSGGEVRDGPRKEEKRAFRPELYRLKATGEGIFGAIKTRRNGRLRNPRLALRQKEAMLLCVMC